MDDREAIQMMQRCVHELRDMRRMNKELAPAAEAFNVIRKIVHVALPESRGASEDLVWVLEKRIRELEANKCVEAPNAKPE